ncbi:MAG TPA: TonB-dependent receptor [Tepidisphaeraceae bacterium]|jgi:iron complex outermembrane receptor protein|nr:TonB-dependent receptor [Tepidisphaeraceae bacterium]
MKHLKSFAGISKWKLAAAIAAALTCAAWADEPASAPAAPSAPAADLNGLSMEDLMNIQVTSVNKAPSRIGDAPAAVYVIGQDDIRRSGLNSIPELLRMVPGLDVAQVNANEWAISSRGFNDVYANKLLVLMDGRAVYTPLFSGVLWSQQDYMLGDLDRIEVIRGPGATLWGANAVNGVINITSKTAKDTQGVLLDGRYGTDQQDGGIRYGGKIDADTYYRVYAKYGTNHEYTFPDDGPDAHDGWDSMRTGFRIDRYSSADDMLTLQGDAFSNRLGQTYRRSILTPPSIVPIDTTYDESGGNLLGRWTHKASDGSEFMLQSYVDRYYRGYPVDPVGQDTFDIEFQHIFTPVKNNQITWGGGYRLVSDSADDSQEIQLDPNHRVAQQVNLFAQDNITLIQDRLHLFLGSKFEENSYSDFEVEPGARILWSPSEQHSVWASISHAVRTPARSDEDATDVFSATPTQTLPAFLTATGNVGLTSEKLTAYEVGYRFEPTKRFSVDVAAFANRYDDLIAYTQGDAPGFVATPIPHLEIPLRTHNALFGETYGAEISSTMVITDSWRLTASYSLLQTSIHHHGDDVINQEPLFEGSSPRNQFQVRSYYDITKNLELNAAAYYVDNVATADVPDYWRFDANVTWHAPKGMDLAVGVQNAFDNRHPEWGGTGGINLSTEVPRSFYAQATWRF